MNTNDESEILSKKPKIDNTMTDEIIESCQHWVIRKKRFCKMTVGKGKKFCGEHSATESNSHEVNRVVCPLDPKHTVDKAKLQKHLKICNAKQPQILPPYITLACNIGDSTIENGDSSFRLQDLPSELIEGIVKIIDDLFTSKVDKLCDLKLCTHEILADELSKEEYGSEKRKHLIQTSAILGIMKSEEFFNPQTCIIEYGAGKAALTFWLSKIVENIKDNKIIVIDKASHRHKKDNLIKNRDMVERVRADIADLNLKGLKMEDKYKSFVGVSKHLCGGATDLTLRCIIQGNESSMKTRDFIICTCCQHRCSWGTFVGKDWLLANGIDQKSFEIIIKMVGWYVCGDGLSRNKHEPATEEKEQKRKSKAEIGWKCKRILDHARVQYMIKNNYDARMCYYVDESVTLENVCIIGKYQDSGI
ncbi:CLUMA_CG014306, isoform A [Clunio marinus]|uniref:tRNA:m(4)X modification enzyme TRM13 n=1 Tax=Clunio marinus TaxID=568069 RepID=A0A1J1IQV7_9DIPT|nr:CLUMA_CG014306, isoform A [Clunio marinus]